MKGSSAVAALFTTLLCIGCSQPGSPTGPSPVTGSQSLASPAGGAGTHGPSAGSGAAQSVPFNGSLEGTQAVTPVEPPFALVEGTATGTATYLGRFEVAFPHTVNFATASGVGTYTFTAVNGDTLTANFIGQAQRGATVTSIVEHATITGGTGRFAGATGSFIVQRLFYLASGVTSGSFEGTISSPGSDRP